MNQVTASYTGTALIDNVVHNPGALWLIGNEFDARYNGSPIQAELYAELYHYFYTTIKIIKWQKWSNIFKRVDFI